MDTDADSFYLYITSRKPDSDSENTSSKFTNLLPLTVTMRGDDWYCGLKEVHFPSHWLTLKEDDAYFELAIGNVVVHAEVPPGTYTDCQDLCRKVDGAIRQAGEGREAFEPLANTVSFLPDIQCAKFKIQDGVSMRFRSHLASMLGFGPQSYILRAGVTIPPRAMDITGGIDSFYLYTNLTSTRIVGNTDVPLLRIVPLKLFKGCRYMEYRNPSYMRVNTQDLNSVEAHVVDSAGRYVPWSICSIHDR